MRGRRGRPVEEAVFSPHTERRHASAARRSDVSSLRDVYLCCVVCGSQNRSFIQSVVEGLQTDLLPKSRKERFWTV